MAKKWLQHFQDGGDADSIKVMLAGTNKQIGRLTGVGAHDDGGVTLPVFLDRLVFACQYCSRHHLCYLPPSTFSSVLPEMLCE
jgi:hypothetical protein